MAGLHARALALGPDFWLYWRDAGVTSFRLGQYATAEADFGRAVSLWNDPITLAAWGDAAVAVGDLLVHGLPVRSAIVVAVVATGAAVAAGTTGTLRLVGRGPNLRWFAAGLLGGVAGAWLR